MIYTKLDQKNKKIKLNKDESLKQFEEVASKSAPKTFSVLIAEDEEALANALTVKLNSAGYSVELAKNGVEVLEKLLKKNYDLILLDLLMPQKDGFEVLEELKDKIHPPIIILSNLSQEEDIERTKQLGAKDFWVKSNFQLAQIVKFLDKYLK